MPACARVPTYHSAEQRLYSQQAQAMLMKTPEYRQFAKVEEQTEDLRLSWILGLMFFVIMVYADTVVFFTEQGDGKGFVGGFLRLNAFPPLILSVMSAGFLLYPVGWVLLAPWFGMHGPVEFTRLKTVILGHIFTAALFALSGDANLTSFLKEGRLPTAKDYRPVSLQALLPAFIGALVPLLTGLLMRWWLCSGSWRKRTALNMPHLWLPPLHFALTVPLMFALTMSLRHLMVDTNKVNIQNLAGNADLVMSKTVEIATNMAKTAGVKTWNTRAGSNSLNQYVSFAATYLLLLMTTQLEIYLFSPLLKRMILPTNARVVIVYFVGLSAAALHFWRSENSERPLVFYMIASYSVMLFARGLPQSDEAEARNSPHDPEDDPK